MSAIDRGRSAERGGGPRRGTEPSSAEKRGTRRRYTAARRARLLRELAESGLTQADCCRQHGVSPATLLAWRRAAKDPQQATRPKHCVYTPVGRRTAVEAFQKSGMT